MFVMTSLLICSLIGGATVQFDVPVYECFKIDQPPKIDGLLTDPVWATVPTTTPFVISCSGEPAQYETLARLCWDDRNLYIAFYCEDPAIWGTLTKRDSAIFNEEVVEVFLQPDVEGAIYYEFEVSPRNVQFDAVICAATETGRYRGNSKWNCKGMKSAVFVEGTAAEKSDTDKFWQVEISIPFKGLERQAPQIDEVWRANLYRIESNDDAAEYQAWSPTLTGKPNFHVPSRFGILVFKDALQTDAPQ